MVSSCSGSFRNEGANPGRGYPNLFPIPGTFCSLLFILYLKRWSVCFSFMPEATFFCSPGLQKQKCTPMVTATACRTCVHACMCGQIVMNFILILNLKLCILHIPVQSSGGGEEMCVYRFFFSKTNLFPTFGRWPDWFYISNLEMDLELSTLLNGRLGLPVFGRLENCFFK